jgi:hypothetical protein
VLLFIGAILSAPVIAWIVIANERLRCEMQRLADARGGETI